MTVMLKGQQSVDAVEWEFHAILEYVKHSKILPSLYGCHHFRDTVDCACIFR